MTNLRIKQLFDLLKNDPEDSFLQYAIAKEYEKTEDLDSALSYYNTLVDKDPEYVGTYYHMGKLLEKMQKQVEALHTYDKGIAMAEQLNDLHSLSELKSARMNLIIELDDL